jgi:hypothetical protein
MIKLKINTKGLTKDLNNMMEYSIGFLQGAEAGKKLFFQNLGASTVEVLKQFIDSMARTSPETLHHIYEWNQTGSPEARLFDINYVVTGAGLSLNSTFRQSTTIKSGSSTPFYDKARIMEDGISVQIRPKKATVLAFEVNGEPVFTANEVNVNNPGGPEVQGSYERAFDLFINQYFSQAFLNSSGIIGKLKDLSVYKRNLKNGARSGGRQYGHNLGYKWIVNAGVINNG